MENQRCYGCMRPATETSVCPHCGWHRDAQNAPHQLPAGTVLREQYLIGKVLGQGGFGITYLGWDLYLDTTVAIKEYYPSGMVIRESTQSPEVVDCSGDNGEKFRSSRERFLREAKSLARFSKTPEIVHVQNFFQTNNTAYIVMEYVEGINLKQYLKERGGRLEPAELFAILAPVMKALTKVHAEGLVHRDISPDNIMMQPDGSAKLLDFGAVRDVGGADVNRDLTKSTESILKHGFAPIEQYQKRGSLGPWTDVYALCATMYYCLSGEIPPDAPERMLEDVEPQWDTIQGLTEQQRTALKQGMALRAKDRTPSVEALSRQLFGGEKPKPEPKPAPKPVPKAESKSEPKPIPKTAPAKMPEPKPAPKKRKKGAFLWLVLLLLAAFAVGTAFYMESQPGPDAWRSNVLMQDWIDDARIFTAGSHTVLGSQIPRGQIRSVTFRDTVLFAPSDAWDASQDGDGSVLAWVKPNGNKYDLYIAGRGGINASQSCEKLFAGYSGLETIDFGTAFHTEGAASMGQMFHCCSKLETLDLSGFDTAAVTDMDSMFYGCISLRSLDISSFSTENVEDMGWMFYRCSTLTGLDLAHFHTGSVRDMNAMFSGCSGLTRLDISGFDTANVTDMGAMFSGCCNLKTLEVSHFNTANVTNLSAMFRDCSGLAELDVSNFDTRSATNLGSMFQGCRGLSELYVANFNTANVETMHAMFSGCTGLRTLDISGFQTDKVTTMSNLFRDCSSLTGLDLSCFVTSNVTNMSSMFQGCSGLTSLDLTSFTTIQVNHYDAMFYGCRELIYLDLGSFDTACATSVYQMFWDCESLMELKLSWKFSINHLMKYGDVINPEATIGGVPWKTVLRVY